MKQLLEFGISRKQSLSPYHLGFKQGGEKKSVQHSNKIEVKKKKAKIQQSGSRTENATNGPHINTSGVMRGSKQDLGSPIPKSNNLMSVALERDGQGAAEARSAILRIPRVEKQILRLEITVEDAMGVAVGDALAELVEKAPDQIGRQRPRIGAFAVGIDEFLEIGIEVLEDEVEDGLGGLGGVLAVVGVLDAEEADDVERLREHLEERNLPESRRRNAFLVHFETSLLESDQLAGRFVLRLVDLPVRAFADLL